MKLITAALILESDTRRRLMLALELTAAERYGCTRAEVLPEYRSIIEDVLYDKFLSRGKLDFCLGIRLFRTIKLNSLPEVVDHSNFTCEDYSSVFSIGGAASSPKMCSVIKDGVVYLFPDENLKKLYCKEKSAYLDNEEVS
jgi:hypothetical protein